MISLPSPKLLRCNMTSFYLTDFQCQQLLLHCTIFIETTSCEAIMQIIRGLEKVRQ